MVRKFKFSNQVIRSLVEKRRALTLPTEYILKANGDIIKWQMEIYCSKKGFLLIFILSIFMGSVLTSTFD